MTEPQVTGADLLALGYKCGPKIGEILEYAHKAHLSGVKKDDVLKHIRGTFGAA